MSDRPIVKIGPQTADSVEVYIGAMRIVASQDRAIIEGNGVEIEVRA